MRNLRLAALGLLALLVALGYVGVGNLLPEAAPATRLYMILQLFFVEGEWTLDHAQLPWQIQLVRFTAPVFLVASLALLFVQDALTALLNASVRLLRGHVIVVGLNELALPFVYSAHGAGRSVVVLCNPSQQDAVAEVRSRGVRVLTGNVLDTGLLRRAGIGRAGYLVAFMDDGVNVELAMRVRQALRSVRRGDPLKARVHLRDTRLGERLEEYPKFFDDAGVAEVSLFNVGERTARILFQRYPLDVFADSLGLERVKLVLFGFNDIARNVVLAAARLAHYADGRRACVTLVAPDAGAAASVLLHEHPLLRQALDFGHLEADLANESLLQDIGAELADASMFVVCLENDIRSVEFALYLRRQGLAGRGMNAPIMVHTRNGGGIARLLEADEADVEIPDGLFPFGLLSEVLAVDNVVDERVDDFAVAIHEHYLAGLAERNRPSHVEWPRLPEVWRRENRHVADHMDIKFRAVGMRMVRRDHGAGEPQLTLSPDEIELLARMEKERWLAAHELRGFQHGEQRGDYGRTHELMLPWEALSDDARAWDRSAAAALPDVVRHRFGLDVARELLVGICMFDPPYDSLETLLDGFVEVCAAHPGHVVGIMSCARHPLERELVSAAQQRLRARSYVVLPLPDDLYLIDLTAPAAGERGSGGGEAAAGEAAVRDYRRMVGRASQYFELPLRFGGHDDLSNQPAARNNQLALAHAYFLQRCGQLLLVGGGPERQRFEHWQQHGVDAEFRFPGRFFPEPGGSLVAGRDGSGGGAGNGGGAGTSGEDQAGALMPHTEIRSP